MKIPVKHTRVF